MHVRTGAFVESDMYMWAERVDAEVEAEWALLEAPEHASYNQAAVFNIRVHFNSYLFRYSWQRRRHGERGVAFLFPGRRAALLRFFWGAKGQDEKDRHSEGGWGWGCRRKEQVDIKKAWLHSVLCWLDILCKRRALEAPGPPGRGVCVCMSSILQFYLMAVSKTNHQWSCCHTEPWPRQTAVF